MRGISVGYKPGKGGATPQPAYQEKTISIVENGETSVVPDGGFDALSKVTEQEYFERCEKRDNQILMNSVNT